MSTAKKDLLNQSKSSELAGLEFESFAELQANFPLDLMQESWTVTAPTTDLIKITLGDLSVVLLNSPIWSNEAAMGAYRNAIQDPTQCICIVSHFNDYALRKLHELDDDIQELCLPINGLQLKLTLQNLFKMQLHISSSESRQETVAEASQHVKYVLQISRELNGIRDTNKLLSLILTKARDVTNADAGSIYVVERKDRQDKDGEIIFKITQNETVNQALDEFRIPISENSIVGKAVIQEKSINIEDLYELGTDPEKNKYGAKHDKSWDKKIGYQCRSMLTLPMFDISHEVIGVIQLINKKKSKQKNLKNIQDFSAYVEPFDQASVEYAEIVAQQAGIALENAMLTEERENLFDGFVHASVTAIEQRDPTTSGHSNRVAQLCLETAHILDRLETGPFRKIRFNKSQLKEIEYASLLHDFGKLGVREQVLVKAKKLYPWEMELLLERFGHIRSRLQVEFLEESMNYYSEKKVYPPGFGPDTFQKSYEDKLAELDDFMEFILKSNEPTVLEQGGFERLKDIANLTFTDFYQKERPFLSNKELEALSVSRGSLTREEFAEIQSHVTHTYEFLRKIPWGRDLSNVPQIAAKHHEKLDGSGYPTSAVENEIPIQTRIMTIADIYDALTASDRPYKRAVPVEKALDILNMEVKAGKLDKNLFNVFKESKVYEFALASKKKRSY